MKPHEDYIYLAVRRDDLKSLRGDFPILRNHYENLPEVQLEYDRLEEIIDVALKSQ